MQVVEYYKEYKGEEPFFMKGQKYVYCWGKYPNGSVDIAVYSYANDFAYDYNDFRSAMGINEITNNLQENMENSIKDKVMQLKEIQAQLDSALAAYKESIAELEANKGNLVPEVMEAFKGQTQGAEKLKVAIDGIMVEITQESERLSTSYKDAFETALTKVNENTRKVLEQILEDSKVASKVKGQMKIDGSKVYEDMGDMFGKLKDWLSRAANKITGFSSKAEEGIGEIEAMLNNHEEEEANKYAASNMDDIEAGAIRETNNEEMNESEVIKNAATKHVLKGMGAEAPKNTVGAQPTTGGQVIKNAATKDMAKGKGEALKGEKSLEEPKKENGVVKNAATKDVEGGKTAGPASQNIEKQPTTGGQAIKNAATKDMSKAMKSAPAKAKVVSEDLDTNDGVNKMDEDEVIKNAATKDIKGSKTEVGGKTSGLKNMEEESELALRAGAKGKVYESEMEEEGWMNETEMGMAENANANVAAEIAKRLGEIGIGGNEAALTAGLEAAMANPSPEAEAKAKELLGLPDAPVDQNPVFESADVPTTAEFLAAVAGVISLFGLTFVLSYKKEIIATLKKTFGKGEDTVKEYGDEHAIPTDNAVQNMSASAPKEESWMNEEEEENEKLNEAVNRMKQILKY
jgi:hypothetical protein